MYKKRPLSIKEYASPIIVKQLEGMIGRLEAHLEAIRKERDEMGEHYVPFVPGFDKLSLAEQKFDTILYELKIELIRRSA